MGLPELRDLSSNLGSSLDSGEITLLCPLVLGWLSISLVQELLKLMKELGHLQCTHRELYDRGASWLSLSQAQNTDGMTRKKWGPPGPVPPPAPRTKLVWRKPSPHPLPSAWPTHSSPSSAITATSATRAQPLPSGRLSPQCHLF